MAMIVAFDGSVCAGKTTAAQTLSQEEGVVVIPEYMQVLDSEQTIEFDKMDRRARLDYLLGIESQRLANVSMRPQKVVLLDRSAFTLFAFEYSLLLSTGQRDEYILERIENANYLMPDKIIFFDVNEDVRRARCEERGTAMAELLLESTFNINQKKFFLAISEVIYVRFIDTTVEQFPEIYQILRDELHTENILMKSKKQICSKLREIFET